MNKYIRPATFFTMIVLAHIAQATTIVLIRNQEAVYIGADSRIVDQNGESLGIECKMMKIGDLFFANAGLGVDAMYGFNIKEIAVNVFCSAEPFEQKLQDFILKVDDECSAYLQRIKFKRKDIYERIMAGRLNIETMIAGRDEFNAPFFQVIKFAVDPETENIKMTTPVLYGCPGDCRGGKVVALMGQMANTEEIVNNRASSMMRNPVKAINFIINREIKNTKSVGGPITILKIGREKTTWLQHDKRCLDK